MEFQEHIERRLNRSARRRQNREGSTHILNKRGIKYRSFNNGLHFVLNPPGRTIDFWPGTGLFRERKTGYRGRGVFNLIEYLGECDQ